MCGNQTCGSCWNDEHRSIKERDEFRTKKRNKKRDERNEFRNKKRDERNSKSDQSDSEIDQGDSETDQGDLKSDSSDSSSGKVKNIFVLFHPHQQNLVFLNWFFFFF